MRDKLFDHEVRILDTLVKFLLPVTWRVLLVGNVVIIICLTSSSTLSLTVTFTPLNEL